MKPTCFSNTNTFKYNFIKHVWFSRLGGTDIIPLKSKLYYDERLSEK